MAKSRAFLEANSLTQLVLKFELPVSQNNLNRILLSSTHFCYERLSTKKASCVRDSKTFRL